MPLSRAAKLAIGVILGVLGWSLFAIGHHKGPLFGPLLPDNRYLTMAPFFFFGVWLRGYAAAGT